ncbi:c-type cytochrome domain-containing protein, partial [Singulisphaera rosea]
MPRGDGALVRLGSLALAILLGLGLASPTLAGPTDAEGIAFFEKNIRPILVERCYSCHSTQAKKIQGGLSLDTKAGWEKGGDLGTSIEPGAPDKSLLIEAVRYKDDLKMPPKGKLPDREVALLTRWVAMGAPDPRT